MVATWNFYANGLKKLQEAAFNLTSDTIKCGLLVPGHIIDKNAHDFWDDVQADEITGTGYTAGGATLGSKSITITAANSWGTSRANSTAYVVGDVVKPASGNGHLYRCIVAGTSGGSVPTWPTVSRQTVTDGSVTWAEIGTYAVCFICADISWTTATLSAGFAVVYKDTGTAGTSPLLGYWDLGGTIASTNGTFLIDVGANGVYLFAG